MDGVAPRAVRGPGSPCKGHKREVLACPALAVRTRRRRPGPPHVQERPTDRHQGGREALRRQAGLNRAGTAICAAERSNTAARHGPYQTCRPHSARLRRAHGPSGRAQWPAAASTSSRALVRSRHVPPATYWLHRRLIPGSQVALSRRPRPASFRPVVRPARGKPRPRIAAAHVAASRNATGTREHRPRHAPGRRDPPRFLRLARLNDPRRPRDLQTPSRRPGSGLGTRPCRLRAAAPRLPGPLPCRCCIPGRVVPAQS